LGKIIKKHILNISIVIPVYNVEKSLIRCLNSIFGQQTLSVFEVIAVDDKSTDNSLQILNNYQKKEPRLIVIEHDSNKKLSIARTTGMKRATGDYIMHVDSDDYLIPGAIECLYKKILAENSDVIVFNYMRESSNGVRKTIRKIKKEQTVSEKLKFQSHFYGACWNKIVKRNITRNMSYGQKGINNGEDLLYATEVFIRAKSISLIENPLYVYCLNYSSLTQIFSTDAQINTLTNITYELSNLLNDYNETHISQVLYNLRLKYTVSVICKNIFTLKSLNLNKLIKALEDFPNPIKTRINLSRLERDPFYCIFQIIIGRIGINNAYILVLPIVSELKKMLGK
jgi:glycosyltransferase involved in cell wall biosynthesis